MAATAEAMSRQVFSKIARAASATGRPSLPAISATAVCAFAASPICVSPRTIIASVGVGQGPPKAAAGPSRRGPMISRPSSTRTRLSPPRPMDRVLRPRMSVRWPSMVTPSGSSRGTPSASRAMSVVVPPMSTATASAPAQSARLRMPMTLAAGPERIVCTGCSADRRISKVPPSALRMYRGALMPARAANSRISSTKRL